MGIDKKNHEGYADPTTYEALNNISDALYPGEYASNLIGRAHMNYKNLNYGHLREMLSFRQQPYTPLRRYGFPGNDGVFGQRVSFKG